MCLLLCAVVFGVGCRASSPAGVGHEGVRPGWDVFEFVSPLSGENTGCALAVWRVDQSSIDTRYIVYNGRFVTVLPEDLHTEVEFTIIGAGSNKLRYRGRTPLLVPEVLRTSLPAKGDVNGLGCFDPSITDGGLFLLPSQNAIFSLRDSLPIVIYFPTLQSFGEWLDAHPAQSVQASFVSQPFTVPLWGEPVIEHFGFGSIQQGIGWLLSQHDRKRRE